MFQRTTLQRSFNMTGYFENTERLADLEQELESWVETPFRHRACVKHLGCDCINFIIGVLKHFSFLPDEVKNIVPKYDPDWHLHKEDEILLEGIKKRLNTVDVLSVDGIKDGDLILYKIGKASAHCAFYLDHHIYHSVTDIGVIKIHFEENPYRDRISYILRIVE